MTITDNLYSVKLSYSYQVVFSQHHLSLYAIQFIQTWTYMKLFSKDFLKDLRSERIIYLGVLGSTLQAFLPLFREFLSQNPPSLPPFLLFLKLQYFHFCSSCSNALLLRRHSLDLEGKFNIVFPLAARAAGCEPWAIYPPQESIHALSILRGHAPSMSLKKLR